MQIIQSTLQRKESYLYTSLVASRYRSGNAPKFLRSVVAKLERPYCTSLSTITRAYDRPTAKLSQTWEHMKPVTNRHWLGTQNIHYLFLVYLINQKKRSLYFLGAGFFYFGATFLAFFWVLRAALFLSATSFLWNEILNSLSQGWQQCKFIADIRKHRYSFHEKISWLDRVCKFYSPMWIGFEPRPLDKFTVVLLSIKMPPFCILVRRQYSIKPITINSLLCPSPTLSDPNHTTYLCFLFS